MRFRKVIIPLIILGTMWLSACGGGGSDGPLDEVGQRYTASLFVLDNDESVIQIDMIQSDCDGEPEEYSDTLAEVDISLSADAPGITLKRYTIDYEPLENEFSGGSYYSPELISSPIVGYATFSLGSGGSGTIGEFTFIAIEIKDKFAIEMGWLTESVPGSGVYDIYDPPGLGEPRGARYNVVMRLVFEDITGNEKVINVERTVYFRNYDNC